MLAGADCVDRLPVLHSKTSFEKNCFSAWASTLNMGLINKVDMTIPQSAPTKG